MNAVFPLGSAFQGGMSDCRASELTESSSLSPRGTKIGVPYPKSSWIADLRERLNELTSLSMGWDGYQGRPVSFSCAMFAANLIERLFVEDVPPPQLVPGADGTLQMEWHRNGFDIEIDVLAPYEVFAVRRNLRTDEVEELELEAEYSDLGRWIANLRDTPASEVHTAA